MKKVYNILYTRGKGANDLLLGRPIEEWILPTFHFKSIHEAVKDDFYGDEIPYCGGLVIYEAIPTDEVNEYGGVRLVDLKPVAILPFGKYESLAAALENLAEWH